MTEFLKALPSDSSFSLLCFVGLAGLIVICITIYSVVDRMLYHFNVFINGWPDAEAADDEIEPTEPTEPTEPATWQVKSTEPTDEKFPS